MPRIIFDFEEGPYRIATTNGKDGKLNGEKEGKMATPSTAKPPTDPVLNSAWTTYRLWANTANYNRGVIDRFTKWSLGLAIGGAIVATIGEQHLIPGTATGAVASAAIALSAFLSKQAQGDNRVSIWTQSRAAAEFLKSGLFLYRVGGQPFDGQDRAAQMTQRVQKVLNDMAKVESRQPEQKPVPELGPLTVDDYIKTRVQEQIDWYSKRARDHQGSADFCRNSTTGLGAVSVLLTVSSAMGMFGAWVPVIATITASITAFLKSQQYQMLAATYKAAASRLMLLRDQWLASGKTDADKVERNAFIQSCEATMATENGGWSALWSTQTAG